LIVYGQINVWEPETLNEKIDVKKPILFQMQYISTPRRLENMKGILTFNLKTLLRFATTIVIIEEIYVYITV